MSTYIGLFGFMVMIVVMVEVHRRSENPQIGGFTFQQQMMLYGTWVFGLLLFVAGIAGAAR